MNVIDSIQNKVGMKKNNIEDVEISKDDMYIIDMSNMSDKEKKEAVEKI